jgi:hypothetical protein
MRHFFLSPDTFARLCKFSTVTVASATARGEFLQRLRKPKCYDYARSIEGVSHVGIPSACLLERLRSRSLPLLLILSLAKKLSRRILLSTNLSCELSLKLEGRECWQPFRGRLWLRKVNPTWGLGFFPHGVGCILLQKRTGSMPLAGLPATLTQDVLRSQNSFPLH